MSLSLREFRPRCDELSLREFHPRYDEVPRNAPLFNHRAQRDTAILNSQFSILHSQFKGENND